MKKIILATVFFLISTSPALAHPGRTAADGCHYCRTNCASWGVAQDERHCHGGSTVPVVTAVPIKVATPTPTRIYRPTPTKVAPTPTEKQILNTTPTIAITSTHEVKSLVSTIAPSPTVRIARASSGGFWGWLSRLFSGK